MVISTKKLKNEFELPVFGLGTWGMGGKYEHDLHNDDEADITAINAAIDLGITHIDTAEVYAKGYSEVLLGKAIKNHDRSKLFLVSKVFNNHFKYDDVLNSAKESLKRLQTTYLDMYVTHLPNPADVEIQETMKAMNTLLEEGLIKSIGISNYNVEQIKEAQSYSKNKIVAAQMHYNLIFREVEKRGVLKYCQENDMMLVAYRPLQKGVLLDTPILKELAKKYYKTPAQIALNWLISQDNVVTIAKTRDTEHLKENLGAINWQMDNEDIEKLRIDFPDQQEISDSNPLK